MNVLPINNINLDNIKNAAKRISKSIKRTPCILSWELSEKYEYPIYLKLENLQITGGFKIRGNANKLSLMKKEKFNDGVVTASSGNHGLGMSLSAMRNSIPATVVVPEKTPKIKIKRLKNYNAEVIVEGKTYDDSVEIAKEISNDTGAVYIPSFDDPDIILGNSTMGLEIFEDVPDVKRILCPIGGGGGISGIGLAFKNLNPNVKIIGVQAEGANAMLKSINNERLTKLNDINTLADGIAVSEPGKLPYKIVKQIVDEILLVSDEEMKKALQFLLKQEKIVAELAGVASVTALDKISIPSNPGSIVCVITGGNIDTSMLVNILNQ